MLGAVSTIEVVRVPKVGGAPAAKEASLDPRAAAPVGEGASAPRDSSPAVPDAALRRLQALEGAGATSSNKAQGASEDPQGLTDEERAQVEELKARDREVRAHEQAHATVGGQYAGAPSYTYQVGPDGQRYAVGGEVAIDVSPIPDDPEATIQKMEVVKAAALAPAEPSDADRQVAALADQQRAAAQAQLISLRAAERSGEGDEAGDARSGPSMLEPAQDADRAKRDAMTARVAEMRAYEQAFARPSGLFDIAA